MRRSVEYCWYAAKLWDARKNARDVSDTYVLEGLRAYATEQCVIERDRGTRWFTTWGSIRHRAKEVLEKKLGEEEQDLDVPEIVIPEDDDQDPYLGVDDV
jgi:hypothetical protein